MIISKDIKLNKIFLHRTEFAFESFIESYEYPNNIIITNQKIGNFTGAKVIEKLTDLKQDWKHYKKKPVIIKATEITEEKVAIQTREGLLYGYKGDFIIQGIQGEVYPCGREIFFKTYEVVKDGN